MTASTFPEVEHHMPDYHLMTNMWVIAIARGIACDYSD